MVSKTGLRMHGAHTLTQTDHFCMHACIMQNCGAKTLQVLGVIVTLVVRSMFERLDLHGSLAIADLGLVHLT